MQRWLRILNAAAIQIIAAATFWWTHGPSA